MTSGLTIVGKRDAKLEELVRGIRPGDHGDLADRPEHAGRRESGATRCAAGGRTTGRRCAAAAGDAQASASGDERDPAGRHAGSDRDAGRHAGRGQRMHRRTASPGRRQCRAHAPARPAGQGTGRARVCLRRRQGRRRNDHDGGERRDHAREVVVGECLADRSAPCLWRCRGVPRRRCALLGARCPREPAPARRAVSEESRLPDGVGARSAGVRRPSGDAPARRAAPWLRDPARRVAVRLHRPRRPQVGSDGARQPRRRRQPRRGRQPGTGHRSECRPHGGGHASAIPEDERHDRHQPYGRSFGDQSTGCRESRRRQRSPTRSPATTAVRCWRCTRAGRSRSTITISSRRRLPRSRGIWQGSTTRKPTAPQRAVSRDFCPDAVNHSEAKDSIA